MAVDIQSKEVIDNISRDLKVQPAMQIPRQLADKIQLVYSVLAEPERLVKSRAGVTTDATSATIHTTHATKDTYLIGVELTVSKSVLATSTSSTITAFEFEGTQSSMASLLYEPLTAGQFVNAIMFPLPIKLQRNTIIAIANGAAVASLDVAATVYFYEVDPQ